MANAKFNGKDLVDTARDSLYVTVGLGVLAFQRAQVRRVELSKQLEEVGGSARTHLGGVGKTLEDNVKMVEERLDAVLDDVQGRLPESTRSSVQQARDAAKEARHQLRAAFSSAR